MTRFALGLYSGDNTPDIPAFAGFDGNDQFTKLLTHFTHGSPQGWDFSVPSKGRATAFGNAAHGNGQWKFGWSSLLLDGTGDYLQFPDHADWNFGTGDFTIDCWVRIAGAPAVHHCVYSQQKDATFTQMLALYVLSGGQLYFELRDGSTTNLAAAQSTAQLTTGVWAHIALERYGSAWTLYKDGVAVAATTYAGAVPDIAAPLTIGELPPAGWTLNGNLTEIRVSKGIARYKGVTFTPPTAQYQYERIHGNDKYTKLLLHMSPAGGQATFRDYSPSIGASLLLDYLIVGGGGGGAHPGGGAGGGVREGTMTVVGSSFPVVVGGGGAVLADFTDGTASNGGLSSFGGITSLGGGGGGGYGNGRAGAAGGSGGGGGSNGLIGTGLGGLGTAGQGNNGGTGMGAGAGGNMSGGGGGGAGAVGGNAAHPNSGKGGNGIQSALGFGGGTTYYGGGGGGTPGSGGTAGGNGLGGGVANSGGGGPNRAAGYSGIVIIRYPGTPQAIGGTITQAGGFTTHTFTASGTFILSASQNNKGAATVFGNTVLSTAQMYFGGASALFDGAGDYLQFADSADWTADTDWTLDCWIRPTALPASGQLACIASQQDGTNGWLLAISDFGVIQFLLRNPGDTWIASANATILAGNWYHVALVHSGTSFTIYVNGVSVATGVYPTPVDMNAPLHIGGWATTAYWFNGYIDEFRISKGIARWTGTFIPPHAPYGVGGNDGYTKLLMHGHATLASGTLDSSPVTKLSHTSSGITLSTNAVWGGNSYSSAGAGYITFPANADYNFGAGDWTVDCWVYPTSLAGTGGIWSFFTDAANRLDLYSETNGAATLQVFFGNVMQATLVSAAGTMELNKWQHFAVVRYGNAWTLYKNGIAVAATTSSYSIPAITGYLCVFALYTTANFYIGQIQELRVSKGIARWTGPFVPPLIPYYGVTANSPDL